VILGELHHAPQAAAQPVHLAQHFKEMGGER
jgi:hypothetical protein